MWLEENTFHLSTKDLANIHYYKHNSYWRLQSHIQKEYKKRKLQVIFPQPYRGCVVQRGSLVKSMSLVPSQDKVLLSL